MAGFGVHYASRTPLTDEDIRQAAAVVERVELPAKDREFAEMILSRNRGGAGYLTAYERDLMRRLVTYHWPALRRSLRPEPSGPARDQAIDLCEIWGMFETGGPLKSAKIIPAAAEAENAHGVDEAMLVHEYICLTLGYTYARPVLLHVFGYGLPPRTMVYRRPGERLSVALTRYGWYEWLHLGERNVPAAVLRRFLVSLNWRLQRDPLVIPRMPHEDEDEVLEKANMDLKASAQWPRA